MDSKIRKRRRFNQVIADSEGNRNNICIDVRIVG
jgi:hypothetical protein